MNLNKPEEKNEPILKNKLIIFVIILSIAIITIVIISNIQVTQSNQPINLSIKDILKHILGIALLISLPINLYLCIKQL